LSRNTELVEVYQARGEGEAHVIKNLLENCGIPCLLKRTSGFIPQLFLGNSLLPMSVMVYAEDAEAAREILKGEDNV